MSRALHLRLVKLEHRAAPPASRVVVIPWGQWPETEEGLRAMEAAHPHGRLFIPEQAPSAEAWEAQAYDL